MDQKKQSEEAKNPTFIEQVDAIIDESYAVKIENPDYGHGLKPRDHKLIGKILDLHEKYIDEKIIKAFVAKISEYYDPIVSGLKKIDDIAKEIPGIKRQLNKIQQRQTNEERRLDEHDIALELNRQTIENAKAKLKLIEEVTKPEVIKEFLDKIEKVTPKLDKIIEINQPKTIRRRIIKAVIISVAICIAIIGLAFFVHNHPKYFLSKKIPQTEVPKDKSTIPIPEK